jgi:2-aminoadipate transaminase
VLYKRRRDVMIEALEEHFPAAATWTEPDGGLFIWATLPDYIDTGDLLAKALRSNVAFVPGQAAYVDGRGANSMRLNFSGVNEDEIREGIRRIGRVIQEQVDLYETLAPGQSSPAQAPPGTPGREAEDVPVDGEAAQSASGDDRNLIPSAPEADRRAAAQGSPGPDESAEGGDVLPFRKASGQ